MVKVQVEIRIDLDSKAWGVTLRARTELSGIPRVGDQFTYRMDDGDDFRHSRTVEAVIWDYQLYPDVMLRLAPLRTGVESAYEELLLRMAKSGWLPRLTNPCDTAEGAWEVQAGLDEDDSVVQVDDQFYVVTPDELLVIRHSGDEYHVIDRPTGGAS